MGSKNDPNRNNNNRNNVQQPEKVYKDESDSPIEQAKMHPFNKKILKTSNTISLLTALETIGYIFAPQWNWDNGDMWDTLYLLQLFGPPVLNLCILQVTRTSKVRDDE